MNNKEFKAYWTNKTLGELRGYIEERERVLNNGKDMIKVDAQKIVQLDAENKSYIYTLKYLSDEIKSYTKSIQDDLKDLEILNPILEKKELEGIDQAEYEKYMTDNNDNIKVLIKAVNDIEEKVYDNTIWTTPDGKEVKLTKKMVHENLQIMLKELIFIIKDNAGDIEEVESLRLNDNKGFDCYIKGNKGHVRVNTILAGGYNIQKLHYRTLVYAN